MERTTSTAPVSAAETAAPNHILSHNGVNLFERGFVHAIRSTAKNGKTQTLYRIAASALGADVIGMKPTKPDTKVLYVTGSVAETNEANRNIQALTNDLTADPDAYLYAKSVDGLSDNVIEIISTLSQFDADLVIIDDICGMVSDPNHINCACAVIDTLRRIARDSNIAIILTITEPHEGEAKGGLLEEIHLLSVEQYRPKKNDNTITLHHHQNKGGNNDFMPDITFTL